MQGHNTMGFTITEFKNVHENWVTQVGYYESLKCCISSSRCCQCSLLVRDSTGTRFKYEFDIPSGVSCFQYCEGKNGIKLNFYDDMKI